MVFTTIKDRIVLAKNTPYGVTAKTYANRTGAMRAAEKVGGCVFQFPGGRAFYVWTGTAIPIAEERGAP